jgi:hypothetical protein
MGQFDGNQSFAFQFIIGNNRTHLWKGAHRWPERACLSHWKFKILVIDMPARVLRFSLLVSLVGFVHGYTEK